MLLELDYSIIPINKRVPARLAFGIQFIFLNGTLIDEWRWLLLLGAVETQDGLAGILASGIQSRF